MAANSVLLPRTEQRFALSTSLLRSVPASVAIALIVVSILIVLAAVGQWLWPVSPNAQNLYLIAAKPGAQHWLGTDTLGRDVFARMIAGSPSAAVGPFIIAAIRPVVSSPLGVWSAYLGGAVEHLR